MMEKNNLHDFQFKNLLSLLAILLGFVALLVFIWLWYNVQLASLDKQQPAPNNLPTIHTAQ